MAEGFNADQNSDIVSGSQLVLTSLHLRVVCKKEHKLQKIYIFSENTFQTCTTNCCIKVVVKAVEMLFDRVLYLEHMMPQPVKFDLQPSLNIGLFYKSAVDL